MIAWRPMPTLRSSVCRRRDRSGCSTLPLHGPPSAHRRSRDVTHLCVPKPGTSRVVTLCHGATGHWGADGGVRDSRPSWHDVGPSRGFTRVPSRWVCLHAPLTCGYAPIWMSKVCVPCGQVPLRTPSAPRVCAGHRLGGLIRTPGNRTHHCASPGPCFAPVTLRAQSSGVDTPSLWPACRRTRRPLRSRCPHPPTHGSRGQGTRRGGPRV